MQIRQWRHLRLEAVATFRDLDLQPALRANSLKDPPSHFPTPVRSRFSAGRLTASRR
jgi:hypothetical protein